jgi:hypothetical protein
MVRSAPLAVHVGQIFVLSTPTSFNSAPNNPCSLAIAIFIKGFKCLDVTEGRVYISHDVVFDETVFPSTKLNPNAGTRLRSKILLLPSAFQRNIVPSHRSDYWMNSMLMCL